MSDAFPPLVDLVPHRPPMLLIEELVEASPDRALTRVRITERSMFFDGRAVPGVVTLEYMAQTIAALVGYQDRLHGRAVQRGVLTACREARFEIDGLAPGDELEVEAREGWTDGAVGQFECAVYRSGEAIARATLSVYRGSLEGAEAP